MSKKRTRDKAYKTSAHDAILPFIFNDSTEKVYYCAPNGSIGRWDGWSCSAVAASRQLNRPANLHSFSQAICGFWLFAHCKSRSTSTSLRLFSGPVAVIAR